MTGMQFVQCNKFYVIGNACIKKALSIQLHKEISATHKKSRGAMPLFSGIRSAVGAALKKLS